MDPTLIIAALAGIFLAIGAAIKTFKERQREQAQQYAIAREGCVSTQYTPQAPACAYNFGVQQSSPTVQQYYRQSIPAPQPVTPYRSEYPWGYNAYIASIANTPLVSQQYSTYYPQTNNVYDGPKYAPRVFEYNTDYHRGDTMNYLMSAQGRAAPPSYAYGQCMANPTFSQAVQSSYPWSSCNTSLGYQFGPTNSTQQCLYNFDIPLNAPVVPRPQSTGPATVRTFADGTVTFCQIPACYNDNGSRRF